MEKYSGDLEVGDIVDGRGLTKDYDGAEVMTINDSGFLHYSECLLTSSIGGV